MIHNRQLKNVCRMNNPNYNGRSRRWHFIIMSLICLSHSLPLSGKSEQGSGREIWVMRLTTRTPPCEQSETAQKYKSFIQFRKTSVQRALSPGCLLTTQQLAWFNLSQLGRRVIWEADNWKQICTEKREREDARCYDQLVLLEKGDMRNLE